MKSVSSVACDPVLERGTCGGAAAVAGGGGAFAGGHRGGHGLRAWGHGATPAASPLTYLRGFAAVFGLGDATRHAMLRIEADEATLMTAWEVGALALRLALPTLVVHDEQDRVNPFSDGQAYAELAAQARLFCTSGLGHRRPLRDAQGLAEMMEFVAAPTA